MPYAWTPPPAPTDTPVTLLTLWPHRSLTAQGFVWFVGLTAGLIALPLLGLLGSPVLWGLLPFLAAALAAIWWALRRNLRDGRLREELTLARGRIELVRTEPDGSRRSWSAAPHWVRVNLHESGGPVEQYLTLQGGGRKVEIGAFLSPEERVALRGELACRLAAMRAG